MEFSDITRAVGDPSHRAQPSPSDVHPTRLAEPKRALRVGSVQLGLGEKGLARGRVSAGNLEPKESAGGDLLSDLQRIRRRPDPGRVNDHCCHEPAPKSWRTANGSAWTCAGPATAPAKLSLNPISPVANPCCNRNVVSVVIVEAAAADRQLGDNVGNTIADVVVRAWPW